MQSGTKHGLQVWHRRSGKETTDLNFTIGEMWTRVGTYIHLFPELKRGRKILWDGMNREGRRFTDYFHPALIRRKLEDAMQIELVNGSIWKIEGVENMDSVIGSNPIGIVYSEFSQMKPAVRSLINPILDENGGWEIVNFTPRGKNHAYELYQMAFHHPDWHCSLLTVDDTRRDAPGEDGSRLITPEQIEARRREGMREPLIQQEYYCSFEAGSALQFIPGEYVQSAFTRERTPWPWASAQYKDRRGSRWKSYRSPSPAPCLRKGPRLAFVVALRTLGTLGTLASFAFNFLTL
jgi:phage terminase large subunit